MRMRILVSMAFDVGIRVVRSRANNAGIMKARCRDRQIEAADVAEIAGSVKIVATRPSRSRGADVGRISGIDLGGGLSIHFQSKNRRRFKRHHASRFNYRFNAVPRISSEPFTFSADRESPERRKFHCLAPH